MFFEALGRLYRIAFDRGEIDWTIPLVSLDDAVIKQSGTEKITVRCDHTAKIKFGTIKKIFTKCDACGNIIFTFWKLAKCLGCSLVMHELCAGPVEYEMECCDISKTSVAVDVDVHSGRAQVLGHLLDSGDISGETYSSKKTSSEACIRINVDENNSGKNTVCEVSSENHDSETINRNTTVEASKCSSPAVTSQDIALTSKSCSQVMHELCAGPVEYEIECCAISKTSAAVDVDLHSGRAQVLGHLLDSGDISGETYSSKKTSIEACIRINVGEKSSGKNTVAEASSGNNGNEVIDRNTVDEAASKCSSPTVTSRDIALYSKSKINYSREAKTKALVEMKAHLVQVDKYLALANGSNDSVDQNDKIIKKSMIKYWLMRNRIFNRFSSGIVLDEESFYSVCPEELSRHIAKICKCNKIIDPFCGAGGNIIQFTFTCRKVIGRDFDASKIHLAKRNAQVYGVQNKIDLKTEDYFNHENELQTDVVFMSPPWGGPEYIDRQVYSLADMCNGHGGGDSIIEIARKIAPRVAIHLPRNVDKNECVTLAGKYEFQRVTFEHNFIDGKLNSITLLLS